MRKLSRPQRNVGAHRSFATYRPKYLTSQIKSGGRWHGSTYLPTTYHKKRWSNDRSVWASGVTLAMRRKHHKLGTHPNRLDYGFY